MDTEIPPGIGAHIGTEALSPEGALRPVAPPWHTVLILLLLLGTSLTNVVATHGIHPTHGIHHGGKNSHVLSYAVTLVWEWILVGLVYWGLVLRKTPLRRLLGVRRDGARACFRDAGVALLFWFTALFVLAGTALLLKSVGLNPENIQRAVAKLAPSTPFELALWIGLSITAGICEELVFRGYLQQQFTAFTRRVWAGIVCSALFFGAAHGYQGLAGMLLIGVYGMLFGVLAHLRGGLRPGMIAHAWQDSLSGLALYYVAHLSHHALGSLQ